MAGLTLRRGQLKGVLTRFWNYVSTMDNDVDQIKIRKEKLEEVWQEFNQVQSETEMEEKDDIDEHYQYRSEFEKLYFKALTEADRLQQAK